MAESERCRETRALMPELATGVAPGDDRAGALAHLAGCADCRRSLREVAVTVDELLLLAPEHEPLPGFDQRVLDAIQPPPTRRSRRAGLLAAVAAVLVAALAAGLTWRSTANDRTVADEYRQVLSTADGRSMTAAALRVDGGATRGTVFGYEGRPSWVFITVAGVDSGRYHVRLVTTAGHSVWIGRCEVRDGSGSWGTDVALPLREVDHVEMYGDGLPTLRADFTA